MSTLMELRFTITFTVTFPFSDGFDASKMSLSTLAHKALPERRGTSQFQKTMEVKGLAACTMFCGQQPWCKAFNFIKGTGKFSCELLDDGCVIITNDTSSDLYKLFN